MFVVRNIEAEEILEHFHNASARLIGG
jgi:hypothetical protein